MVTKIQDKSLRKVRSFVRRGGRLTPSQQHAIDSLWSQFGLTEQDALIDLVLLFQRHAPTVLEIGFGNGKSLIEMATRQPENNFIGIEVYLPGIGQLLRQIEQLGLTNVRVACTDAVKLLNANIANHAIDRLHIYFPDPWHKKRHHKRRIIQPPFIRLIARKIRSGGYVHIATDWQHYAEQMLADFASNNQFINCAKRADYISRPNYRPITKFEQRGQRLGHEVRDLLFKRC